MKTAPRNVRCAWCRHWQRADFCLARAKMWRGWHQCGIYEREPGADDDLELWVKAIKKPKPIVKIY